MMQIIYTIIPIFLIIFLGWLVRKKNFLPDEFLGPANRLVYYIAIPAMVFRAVSTASFHEELNTIALVISLSSVMLVTVIAWSIAMITGIADRQKGTFIQSAFHSNLGYIGLAVVFYFLGEEGLGSAGLFVGFIMILQNILAVSILQVFGKRRPKHGNAIVENMKRIIGHPAILAALSGIVFSLLEIPLPVIAERSLAILSGMALPLALMLIGANLSFKVIRTHLPGILETSFFKLIALPGIALIFFRLFAIPQSEFMPPFILLASPTATLTYVMAKEMNGDHEFAVAAISGCTMISSITFTIWLTLLN